MNSPLYWVRKLERGVGGNSTDSWDIEVPCYSLWATGMSQKASLGMGDVTSQRICVVVVDLRPAVGAPEDAGILASVRMGVLPGSRSVESKFRSF